MLGGVALAAGAFGAAGAYLKKNKREWEQKISARRATLPVFGHALA